MLATSPGQRGQRRFDDIPTQESSFVALQQFEQVILHDTLPNRQQNYISAHVHKQDSHPNQELVDRT